jgi:DNA invertase Pin-like site-specific DNA recombinase
MKTIQEGFEVPNPIRAVEYVRMSTESQEFSIPYQQEAMRRYADERGFSIVRTYSDESKSGLTIDRRDALVQLLNDVQTRRDFDVILVYDVSRWGRFQDLDEAGYYEFLCRKNGAAVHYCAEVFDNKPSPLTAMLKSLKRMAAADYSRDLALRVGLSMRRAVVQGYFPGGTPGYGLRRMLVGTDGIRKGILSPGEWKAIRGGRTILVPGPDHEVATVRRIFDLFVNQRLTRTQIANLLNAEGVSYQYGRTWQDQDVHRITKSERYNGVIVYGQNVSKLGAGQPDTKPHKAPPSQWVRGDAGFGELVSKEVAAAARNAPDMRGYRYRDEEDLLKPLRGLLAEHGYLSYGLIVSSPTAPAVATLRARLGSLEAAYERVGYTKRRTIYKTEFVRRIRALRKKVIHRIEEAAQKAGALTGTSSKYGHVYLRDGRYVKTTFARYEPICHTQHPRWIAHYNNTRALCTTIVVRMDQRDEAPLDYFCVPPGIMQGKAITISAYAGTYDAYRYKTLGKAVARAIHMPSATPYSVPHNYPSRR